MTTSLPFGSWPSPITAEAVASTSPRFDGARFVGDDVWWSESTDDGRMTVRRRSATGELQTLLPEPWNARSRVHEYGGGAWAAAGSELVFVERSDDRVYALRPGAEPRPLTAGGIGARFGGLTVQAGRLIAVAEHHTEDGIDRSIVEIPLDGAAATDAARLVTLAEGTDFVAQPALSPDGARIAWVGWDHPDMPWDRTTIFVAPVGRPAEAIPLTSGTTAALQPTWRGPELLYIDEPADRWNLVVRGTDDAVRPLLADADTGGPLWVLGTRWYGVLGDGRIAAIRTNGSDALVIVDPGSGDATAVPAPVTAGLSVEDARGSHVLVLGSSAERSLGLWLLDLEADSAELIAGGAAPWPSAWLPTARPVTYDGPRGPVHAFDYPPTNPDIASPGDERPPYVVTVHGGPTSHVGGGLSGAVAFFTSRGIGVLDVNYGGSTGYGRAYRERLRGQWGVADVEDVAAAATALAASGVADPARLAVKGGSAGGWTVLCALVGTEVFGAGISRYGVGDARTLAEDTHDFEARYLDGLIGPLPEFEDVYRARSPLMRADRFRAPLLLLQGADDAVVPLSQATAIHDALATRGIPHALVVYEGEGHGFRRAETVVDALRSELAFLGTAFAFQPDGVTPLDLDGVVQRT